MPRKSILRPAQVVLEIEDQERVFFLHPDGRVYQRTAPGRPLRRVRDRRVIIAVRARHRELWDARERQRARGERLISTLGRAPREEEAL